MKNEIKAILFDLGNVLIKIDPEKLVQGLSEYGSVNANEVIDYFMDSDNMKKYTEGKLTSSYFYTRTCRFFKLKIKFREFYRIWNSIFHAYPEMEEIIRAIKKKYPDIKLVLVSNTNESHYEFIKENYNVIQLMDECVVSHEVKKQKPHANIFKQALKIAGSIPKHTFYVDDRLDLIDAARTMGIRAFQFTDHEAFLKDLARLGIQV
ncbi:MAG: HAD family phosphatase [Candidatus Omnitrophota bacterium]